MPDEPPPPAADAAAERLKLDQRRLALDESWPRKWGTIAISVAVPLTVALLGWHSNERANDQKMAAEQAARTDREIKQDQAVIEMFFKYVDGKQLTASERITKLNLLNGLAYNHKLLETLRDAAVKSGGDEQKKPSEVLAGTGSPIVIDPAKGYTADDFTGYIQYFTGRTADSDKVAKALAAMGMRVPGQQKMDAAHSPGNNEIRIYREGQRSYAQDLAKKLEQQTGLSFRVVGPLPGALPDGVLEIWLGKS